MDALTDPLVHEPPPLPYTLRTRKLSIAGFWIVFFIDTFVQPVVLYFTLWYLTDLSANLGMYTWVVCSLEDIIDQACSFHHQYGDARGCLCNGVLLPLLHVVQKRVQSATVECTSVMGKLNSERAQLQG